jgi:opacity protein-like surface antigen
MIKVRILVAGVAWSLLVSAASAQPMIQKGVHELSLHVSPDFEGAVGDMIFAEAGVGLFLWDGFEARGTLSYTILEDVAGEEEDYRTSEFGVAGEAHLAEGGKLVPYVGAGLGWRSTHFGDFEESGLVYGPRAGLKYFLADNVALDLEVTYKLGAQDVFINDFTPEDTDLSSAIGLRVLF